MSEATLNAAVSRWLDELCLAYPDRHVGGPGNQAANELFARVVSGFGFVVERIGFDCLDWEPGGVALLAGGRSFAAAPGPYSPPCDLGRARLLSASSVMDLEDLDAKGTVLLLHGEIVRSQLIPTAYPFFSVDAHRHVYELLEAARPEAILAATGKNPELAGSLYPFPLIEDGDFEIPSAYMKDVDGEALLRAAGGEVSLTIDSRRTPARAEQVVAVKRGAGPDRVVVTAHLDSRQGSPGALDNASGVAALMAVAALLGGREPSATVELVPFNGEDHYAAPGQVVWLERNQGRLQDVVLDVNIDDAAAVGQRSAVSLYAFPDDRATVVREMLQARDGFVEGAQWPQGDHSIFAMRGVPAVAVTSEGFAKACADVIHSERDVPELVDPGIVVEIARFVVDLVSAPRRPSPR